MLGKFLLKSAFYSTIVIGGGYALMVAVVPKEVYRAQMQAIFNSAKSDKPIWEVQWPEFPRKDR
jgi:hypothetical protein